MVPVVEHSSANSAKINAAKLTTTSTSTELTLSFKSIKNYQGETYYNIWLIE